MTIEEKLEPHPERRPCRDRRTARGPAGRPGTGAAAASQPPPAGLRPRPDPGRRRLGVVRRYPGGRRRPWPGPGGQRRDLAVDRGRTGLTPVGCPVRLDRNRGAVHRRRSQYALSAQRRLRPDRRVREGRGGVQPDDPSVAGDRGGAGSHALLLPKRHGRGHLRGLRRRSLVRLRRRRRRLAHPASAAFDRCGTQDSSARRTARSTRRTNLGRSRCSTSSSPPWSALPASDLRPRITQRTVVPAGDRIVVSGYDATQPNDGHEPSLVLADVWDGEGWTRLPATGQLGNCLALDR